MLFNQIIIFTKRICNKITYISLLLILIMLTIVFQLLPEKKKSARINVSVYSEANDQYTDTLMKHLKNKNSIYTFYQTDDKEAMLNDIKAGKAECGFFIPENFFEEYINGVVTDGKIRCYSIPSSNLSPAITETFFNSVFRICAEDILMASADLKDYEEELSINYKKYLESDDVFQLSDALNGQFSFKDMIYRINLPVYEISLLLILFAGLLGLYIYMQDKEKNIYLALSARETFRIESATILAAIIPILFVSLISSIITYGISIKLLYTILFSIALYPACIILGILTKKSSHLSKVLPIILLCAIIAVFISTLLN